MSTFWRAVLVSAVATAAAGAAWMLLLQWSERAGQAGEGAAGLLGERSLEDQVEALSEAQKEQMLDELSQHV